MAKFGALGLLADGWAIFSPTLASPQSHLPSIRTLYSAMCEKKISQFISSKSWSKSFQNCITSLYWMLQGDSHFTQNPNTCFTSHQPTQLFATNIENNKEGRSCLRLAVLIWTVLRVWHGGNGRCQYHHADLPIRIVHLDILANWFWPLAGLTLYYNHNNTQFA